MVEANPEAGAADNNENNSGNPTEAPANNQQDAA